jgi:signal transduction histidine kinase
MDFIELIRTKDKGWTEYWWNKIGESAPSHKVSYIMKVPDTNWLLGAGIYEETSLAEIIKLAGE